MPGRPIRVLVVDDHQMFAQSIVRILADEADIEVVGMATSAKEAVVTPELHRPDVVLLDYDLPDTVGRAGIEQLQEAFPAAKLVMLTGYADVSVLTAAIDAGCAGFVTKDKATSELLRAVRSAAVGEAAISSALLAELLPQLLTASDGRSGVETGAAALTKRETEVLGLLAEGANTEAIAEQLFLSRNTVRNHIQHVITKLGAHSMLEAVAIGVRRGLVKPAGGR